MLVVSGSSPGYFQSTFDGLFMYVNHFINIYYYSFTCGTERMLSVIWMIRKFRPHLMRHILVVVSGVDGGCVTVICVRVYPGWPAGSVRRNRLRVFLSLPFTCGMYLDCFWSQVEEFPQMNALHKTSPRLVVTYGHFPHLSLFVWSCRFGRGAAALTCTNPTKYLCKM